MRIAIIALLLSGCTAVSEVVPSLKYCGYVKYERIERDFELRANCTIPAGIEAPL